MRYTDKAIAIATLAVALAAGLAPRARAQDWFTQVTWQFSAPINDTKNYVDAVSYLGAGLEFRKKITSFGSVMGVSMSWNVFHERTDGTLNIQSGAVSGSQDRYINSFPIMLGFYQYFGNRRSTRFYLGINGGGYVLVQSFRIGVTEFEEDSWEWGAAPEAGVVIPFTTGAWFVVNGRYQWSQSAETLAGTPFSLEYYQVNVGFMWEQ